MPGFAADSASYVRPMRATAPARKFVRNTSACFATASSTSRPRWSFRSTASERLPRLCASKYALSPRPRTTSKYRPGSPETGSSTLMTSAPRSASSAVAYVPCCQMLRSRTRMPASGRRMCEFSALGVRVSRNARLAFGARIAYTDAMSGSPLDDPATYARLDPEDLVSRIEALPGQVEDAWEAGQRLELPASYRRVENIAVLGMGGSGIGGSLLQALGVDLGATAPVFTVRSYTLPAYVDERTLVLASSNSGNTEETVAAFERALERGARCIAIATGGRLAQIARERGVPSLLFEWGGEPRAALGWSFIAPLAICSKTGLLPDLAGPLSDAAGELRTLGGEIARHVDEQANPAKRLARRLAGHLPVFV